MMTTLTTSSPERLKEQQGWRAGRPVEDPEKTKRWGFVTAKPSEFLVHVRRGQVRTRSSGQGASCFKWPRDAVAVIPTSLQQLEFSADQITSEKVGVRVSGVAVYRIADPLVAYRVLNFSFPERAQEKLDQTLGAMLVGATRRLVANLTVEECLQKRKTALADELVRELAPVTAGTGRPEDVAAGGWGVVVDTVEIQDVRVLSEAVFAAMQAPVRAALDRRAREARAEADRDIAAREASCNRAIEEARIAAALAVEERRREHAAAEGESRRLTALREAEIRRETEEGVLAAKAAVRAHEAQNAAQLAEAESQARQLAERLAAEEAAATLAAHEARAGAAARHAELERALLALEVERRRALAEVALAEGRATAEVALLDARAAHERLDGEARLKLAEKLPELAAALGERMGDVRITQIGGDGSPFAGALAALTSVLDLVRKPAG